MYENLGGPRHHPAPRCRRPCPILLGISKAKDGRLTIIHDTIDVGFANAINFAVTIDW